MMTCAGEILLFACDAFDTNIILWIWTVASPIMHECAFFSFWFYGKLSGWVGGGTSYWLYWLNHWVHFFNYGISKCQKGLSGMCSSSNDLSVTSQFWKLVQIFSLEHLDLPHNYSYSELFVSLLWPQDNVSAHTDTFHCEKRLPWNWMNTCINPKS